ncbi:hypothetical protein KBI52_12105 [Microvirga sp. HBU67558]|uniref:hypothetical protein n=1 Tax=Microvirga TaxID=186650 RepID=UPI001B367561|nr:MULTISPECIES: hypothetical protein [unclassified Microvirga]MBQ0820950.1 hypothetical protein [Microvirga sp. HBU67558]
MSAVTLMPRLSDFSIETGIAHSNAEAATKMAVFALISHMISSCLAEMIACVVEGWARRLMEHSSKAAVVIDDVSRLPESHLDVPDTEEATAHDLTCTQTSAYLEGRRAWSS